MRPVRTGVLIAAGVFAGRAAARKVARRRAGDEGPRWLAVTVNAPPDQVEDDPRVGETLDGLDVETRLTRAPGGRGTEIAARLRHAPTGLLPRLRGTDPRQAVRRALRDLKSTIETGEVVRPDEPNPGRPTPGGAVVRLATRHAGGEGRL